MKRSTLKAAVLILLTFISLITIGYTGNYLTRTTGLRSLFPSFGGDIIGDAEAGKKTGVELPVAIEELNAPVRGDNSIEVLAIPTSAFRVSLGRARLSGPAGSLGENTMLSVNALKEDDLPPLEMGMVNVTGTHAAFRMLPHGILFNNDIDIVLPYDKSLLPMGFTENDIRTYYYDEHYGSWIMIELDSVDISNGVVVSRVNHFTDFINAIMKAPEMPETNAYVPTTMSDIQAGNPMESLTLIQPPSANNSGSANLSYPIDIPAGRNGMQPNLNITYNSGGGNGWLGLGWDLNIPMVTIDTRWGVPRYEPDFESETYLLNGEQLVTKDEGGNFNPLAHRAEWKPRMRGDVQFYPRVEGAFNKIIRHGDTPREYWWEVIDKSGTRYFYGKKLGEDSFDENAVLRDVHGRIGKWELTEVRDLNDNFVYYTYSVSGNLNDGFSIYPKKIYYTGDGTTKGKYEIEFINTDNLLEHRLSGRLGLKERFGNNLSGIKISFDTTLVRHYKLNYKNGSFRKLLLHSISEVVPEEFNYSNESEEIITHIFEYYDPPTNMFGEPRTIITQSDNAKANITEFNHVKVSPLGGSETKSTNFGSSLTFGVGPNPSNKKNSAGGNYSRSVSKTEGILTLIDIDGDGLPDKVFKSNTDGKLYYRKQLFTNNEYSFSTTLKRLEGLEENSFQKEKSTTNDWGGEAHANALNFINGTYAHNKSKTKSSVKVYFSDVNGDGLPDIVNEGYVYFNHIGEDSIPRFYMTSPTTTYIEGGACSESGSGTSGSGDGQSSAISYGEVLTEEFFRPGREVITEFINKDGDLTYDTIIIPDEKEVYPPHDLVKVWTAPYSGVISISGSAGLTGDLRDLRREMNINDGVNISIQIGERIIYNSHLDSLGISHSHSGIRIDRGTRIYFRIESLEKKAYDKVLWDPEITYEYLNNLNYRVEDPLSRDANGKYRFKFKSSEDFLVNPHRNYYMPLDGKVEVKSSVLIKNPLSDTIVLRIYRNNVIYSSTYLKDPVNINIDREGIMGIYVEAGDSIMFEISCNTNVNWNDIEWNAKLYYSESSEISTYSTFMNNNILDSVPNLVFDIIPYATDYPKPILPVTHTYTPPGDRDIEAITINLTGAGSGYSDYYFSVKRSGATVIKELVRLQNGTNEISLSRNYTLTPGHEYYFELYCNDSVAAQNITFAKCSFGFNHINLGVSTIHKSEDLIFGNMHRNWGQFNYLNISGEYSVPIIEDSIKISGSFLKMARFPDRYSDHDFEKEMFLMMNPDYFNKQWVGYGNMSYITADTLSNTLPSVLYSPYFGNECFSDNESHRPVPPHYSNGMRRLGIIKVSETQNTVNSYGGGITLVNMGYSTISGNSTIKSDFMDMNGDHYPDVISEYEINYTQPQGGLSTFTAGHSITTIDNNTYNLDESSFQGNNINFGASYSGLRNVIMGGRNQSQVQQTSGPGKDYDINPGMSQSSTEDKQTLMLVDVNGDGLPDKVSESGVYLNLGYHFSFGINSFSSPDKIKGGFSTSFGGTVSGGGEIAAITDAIRNILPSTDAFNLFSTSISGGIGFDRTLNTSNSLLIDINGDGLLDMVKMDFSSNPLENTSLKVCYNNGSGFNSNYEHLINDAQLFMTKGYTGSINAAFSFGFSIPVLIYFIKFVVNPKAGRSWGFTEIKNQFIDMDGDGLPDYVSYDSDDEIKVRYNQCGKTNLLKSVKNIANGSFEIDYELSQNSFESPSRSWTMSDLKVFDGFEGDGVDIQWFKFEYDSARYQRFDREDLGFKQVKTIQMDMTNSRVYRITTEKYHNSNYIRKGLKEYELITDKDGNKYIEKFYNYGLYDIDNGSYISENDFCNGTGFPALKEEKVNYYEGTTQPLIRTSKEYEYGKYGNITGYKNNGDLADPSDDLITEIKYNTFYINKHITGTPSEIIVRDHQQNVIRNRVLSINVKGNILQYKEYGGSVSIYQYSYDNYGNVKKMTMPHNKTNERMVYEYKYDTVVNIYPVEIKDVPFNLVSRTTYDYRWGKPLESIDINNNKLSYTYDWRGRLSKINALNESDYTIIFHYWFGDGIHPIGSPEVNIPWAVTYHNDFQHPGNPITTTLFCDALGRVIQTQKDHESDGIEKIVVSGRITFDPFNRTSEEYYPTLTGQYNSVTDPHQYPTTPVFSTLVDSERATFYEYDILNRQRSITTPDNKSTRFDYSINEDYSGVKRFSTRTVDPHFRSVYTFTDVRGLQTQVKSFMDGLSINTVFRYNAMGELISSIDPDGFETIYEYDNLGRLTKRIHPDAGTDTYHYDMASNLISHKTQKLINENKEINYKYSFNRLMEIIYPDNPENNIRYTYGAYNSVSGNRGRVTEIEDGTGWHRFTYGQFGEVNGHTRTVILPNESQPYTFTMKYTYDMWNRITQIIYPDGEKVKYTYDRGGNLKTVTGTKGSNVFNYITNTRYDKFGKKTAVYYGNNTRTNYLYDVMQRLENMKSYINGGSQLIQDLAYSYDDVGNITSVENSAGIHSSGLGGGYTNTYEYDDLYRLKASKGEFSGHEIFYKNSLSMSYENNGRIKNKNYSEIRLPMTIGGGSALHSTDNSVYNYNTSQPNTLKTVSRQRLNPSYSFTWDANGNMTKYSAKVMGWDEENRMTAAGDNSYNSYYSYDNTGDRTYKLTGERKYLYVNGVGKYYNKLTTPTLYVFPYVVATSTGYTKHIYSGNERIVSKIGTGGLSRIHNHIKQQAEWQPKYELSKLQLKRTMANGINRPVEESDITGNSLSILYNQMSANGTENEIYYYTTDHLGSSSWITGSTGQPVQHLQYQPFGSRYVDQKTSDWNSMYTFSGKERDSETGFSYFGARYYDSGLGIWLSVDPMASERSWSTPYAYCQNNPIGRIDLNGALDDGYTINKDGEIKWVDDTGGKNYDVLYNEEEYYSHPEKRGNYNYKGEGSNIGIRIDNKSLLPDLMKSNPDKSQNSYPKGWKYSPYFAFPDNESEAINVFMFVARNSGVEWTLESNKNNNWIIGTLRKGSQAMNVWQLGLAEFTPENSKDNYHSHGGYERTSFYPSGNDINSARSLKKINPQARTFLYMPNLTKDNYNAVNPDKKINYNPKKLIEVK